jgi:transposase InsO family protein
MSKISASRCAKELFSTGISRYGVPDYITSDRGLQFDSEAWPAVCGWLGITRKLTTAYHQQANGLVEHLHRQLKEALGARWATGDCEDHLPWS